MGIKKVYRILIYEENPLSVYTYVKCNFKYLT